MTLPSMSYWIIGVGVPLIALTLILIGVSSASSDQTKAVELQGQILKSQYHSILESQAFQMGFTVDDEVSYGCWKSPYNYDGGINTKMVGHLFGECK